MSPQLQQRGNKYYFRQAVPTRLQQFFGVKEIRLALNTNHSIKAQRLYEELETDYQSFIDRLDKHLTLGSKMSEREIEHHVSRFVPSKVEKMVIKTIQQAAEDFVKFHESGWAARTKQEAEYSFTLMQTFFGSKKALSDIKISDADNLLTHLKNLKAEGKDTVINTKTVNKHMSRIYSMTNFSISRGWCDKNPFFGIRLKVDRTRKREKKRLPFSTEEHQKIIDEVLEYPVNGEYKRPSMLWVPLLCMFSGCRRTEACQLYREDILLVEGVECISIDNDKPDKRLKNDTSRRIIPLHSKIINFGFLDYIDRFKTGERIFPELAYFRDGYGHSFKRFQEKLRKYVTTDEKKVMHSFRHMISGQLMQKGQLSVWRADLLGHERGELETDATYTELTKIHTLKQMLELVEFPDINFSKCHITHYKIIKLPAENSEIRLSFRLYDFLDISRNLDSLAYQLMEEIIDRLTNDGDVKFNSDSIEHSVNAKICKGLMYADLCSSEEVEELENFGVPVQYPIDDNEIDDYEIDF